MRQELPILLRATHTGADSRHGDLRIFGEIQGFCARAKCASLIRSLEACIVLKRLRYLMILVEEA